MKIKLHSPLAKKLDKIPILPTETSSTDIGDHEEHNINLPDKTQKMQFLGRDCQMILTLICFCLIIFVFGCYFERGIAGRYLQNPKTHAFFRGTDGVKQEDDVIVFLNDVYAYVKKGVGIMKIGDPMGSIASSEGTEGDKQALMEGDTVIWEKGMAYVNKKGKKAREPAGTNTFFKVKKNDTFQYTKKGNKIVIEKVRDLNNLSEKLKEQDNTEKHEVNTGRWRTEGRGTPNAFFLY